jgi:hypothetical protein
MWVHLCFQHHRVSTSFQSAASTANGIVWWRSRLGQVTVVGVFSLQRRDGGRRRRVRDGGDDPPSRRRCGRSAPHRRTRAGSSLPYTVHTYNQTNESIQIYKLIQIYLHTLLRTNTYLTVLGHTHTYIHTYIHSISNLLRVSERESGVGVVSAVE